MLRMSLLKNSVRGSRTFFIPRLRPAGGGVRFLSTSEYHKIADSSLEAITDGYERLIETRPELDVDLSQGVLTILSPPIGTYVINKQPPNQQIWLSSPISGPKRYDFDEQSRRWVNLRDETTLGALLRSEVKETYGTDLDVDIE